MILRIFILLVVIAAMGGANDSAVRRAGTVKDKDIVEASGLAASRALDGIFWTHNDGGDGVLFAIRQDGSAAGRIKIDRKFEDWEDIAADDAGNLYLADTGNNDRDRKRVMVHRIAEPDPSSSSELQVLDTWKLSFPSEPFDCESLVIFKGNGYLISKLRRGGKPAVYQFPLTPSRKPVELKELFELQIDDPVTAADLSEDGSRLAVLTTRALLVYQIDGDIEKARDTTPRRFAIPSVPAEGCCFTKVGVLIIAESGEILLAVDAAPTTTQAVVK